MSPEAKREAEQAMYRMLRLATVAAAVVGGLFHVHGMPSGSTTSQQASEFVLHGIAFGGATLGLTVCLGLVEQVWSGRAM